MCIIAISLWLLGGMWHNTLRPSVRLGRILKWVGVLYLAAAVVRFVGGYTYGAENKFMSAHLPAFFHVVLAAMMLVVANHLGRPRVGGSLEPSS
jgi:hypothetical protein